MSNKPQIYSVYEFVGMLYMWCEQDVFPGGEREVSAIDLKVQRDSVTNVPICRASSLKGPIRAFFEYTKTVNVGEIFGDQEKSGALEFHNAGILLYPLHSYQGLFAYITSPSQLREYWLNHLRNGNIKDAENLMSILNSLEEKLKSKKSHNTL